MLDTRNGNRSLRSKEMRTNLVKPLAANIMHELGVVVNAPDKLTHNIGGTHGSGNIRQVLFRDKYFLWLGSTVFRVDGVGHMMKHWTTFFWIDIFWPRVCLIPLHDGFARGTGKSHSCKLIRFVLRENTVNMTCLFISKRGESTSFRIKNKADSSCPGWRRSVIIRFEGYESTTHGLYCSLAISCPEKCNAFLACSVLGYKSPQERKIFHAIYIKGTVKRTMVVFFHIFRGSSSCLSRRGCFDSRLVYSSKCLHSWICPRFHSNRLFRVVVLRVNARSGFSMTVDGHTQTNCGTEDIQEEQTSHKSTTTTISFAVGRIVGQVIVNGVHGGAFQSDAAKKLWLGIANHVE